VLIFGNETFVFQAYEISDMNFPCDNLTGCHFLLGENYNAKYRQNSYCKKRKDESAKHDVGGWGSKHELLAGTK
jgi:hypothetical protein